MTIDVLMILFVALGLTVFVVSPLFRQQVGDAVRGTESREIEQLTLHKETVYTAIRDLDFDFQTNKVDDQDYRELRHQLEAEAIDLLRHIDAVDPTARLGDEIERQILAMRRKPRTPDGRQSPRGRCVACRAVLQGDEKFCPYCGHALTMVEQT